MNFWHLVKVVRARIWMIIGLVVMTVLVVAIAAPDPKVTYLAMCQMSPTAQAMRGGVTTAANANNGGSNQLPDRNVVLSNLVLLAQSGGVIQSAADFLAMPEDQQRREHPGLPSYRRIPRLLYSREPEKAMEPKDWQDVLSVAPMVNPAIGEKGTISDIIGIKVKLPNGDDASYIANAIGSAFAEAYERKSHEETQKYIEFLNTSMQEASRKLQDVEGRIATAKSQNRVVSVDPETQSAVTSLAALEATRSAAQAAVEEYAAGLREVDRQLAAQPLVQNNNLPADMNPEVVKLRQELAQAEADLRMAATRYTPEHTAYKAIESQIRILKDRIAQLGPTFRSPVLNDLHNTLVKQRSEVASQLASATAKLSVLNGQVAQAQAKLATIPGAQRQIAELTREQQTANEDYTTYAQKLALAKISDRESKEAGSIILFDPAMKAVGPVVDGPRKRTLIIYGFVLALVFGVALAVWLDSIDNRVRNGKDVEELLGLPAVGLIPALEGPKGQLPRLTHIFPLSAAAESYRLLRTQILFAHRDHPFKTLMTASSKPGQGSTTTICNLAIALAQIGKKIVLIDADMRRPSLHDFFGIPNETGLSTLLQGKSDAVESFKQTGIENLIVIPAGPPPLNPSELLASDRMLEIVKRLEEHCDMVLFDTPSTVVFSDGPVLASWLDAVLFVVSANQVPRGTEKQALEMLRKAKANIIGTVVNNLSYDTVDSCYFHSRYYATSMGHHPELPGSNGKNGKNGSGSAALGSGETKQIGKGSDSVPVPVKEEVKIKAEAPETEAAAEDSPFPD